MDNYIEKVKKPLLNLKRLLQYPRRPVSRYSEFVQRVVEVKRGVAEINNSIEKLPEGYKESLQKKSRNNEST